MESQQLADTMSDGRSWPRISIVTPSYNQGQFIEETIRSVLLQGYPDLEFFVIDGGSTDGSVDIIRKYERWLTGWVSERDSGQSQAINKGLAKATASIGNWLNSDDMLCANALAAIGRTFADNPGAIIFGDRVSIDAQGRLIGFMHPTRVLTRSAWQRGQPVAQEATFFPLTEFRRVGRVDESLRFCMDYDLYVRLFNEVSFVKVFAFVGLYRDHDATKTRNLDRVRQEEFVAIKNRATLFTDDVPTLPGEAFFSAVGARWEFVVATAERRQFRKLWRC